MDDAGPLSGPEFGRLLAAVTTPPARGFVLAVSGGPDSMALLHLAGGLRQSGDLPPVTVGTVDHGLRPDSAVDADCVELAARARGLPVRRLLWRGDKPVTALQERARLARYALLDDLCMAVGADHLVTAHTLDDQAETVLFRLLRGSGVAGLAAMRASVPRGAVRHVRPLLDVPKVRLVATCRAADVPFREDPANSDPRFARARMRTMLPHLAGERCDSAMLARLARRAARADDALSHAAGAAFAAVALDAGAAAVSLNGAALAAFPDEVVVRVLDRAVVAAGGTARRLEGLERLAALVSAAIARGLPLRTTCGGTVVSLGRDGALRFVRERARHRGMGGASAARRVAAAPTPTPCETFPWQA